MNTTTRVPGELAKRGQKFYQEKLQAILEPEQIGKFVAIEPETERYFVGETDRDALWAGRAALPDKLFFLARIGYDAAHKIGGMMYAGGVSMTRHVTLKQGKWLYCRLPAVCCRPFSKEVRR